MGKKDTPTSSEPITAEEIQRTVQAAKSLSSIPGQELLEDPRLNPATRARYDALTAERLEAALQADHRRKLAESAEQARQAEEAAKVAEIVDRARRATSPARTIIDMSRHQRTFGRVALAASLLLSVGSAIGLGALVDARGGPMPVGWVAEVGLTGLSTTVIVWRGLLARAGTAIDDRTGRLFLALMVGPALLSVIGSYLGTGLVGVACSVGSALFAGLTYLINTSASAAIGQSIAALDKTKKGSKRSNAGGTEAAPVRESAPAHTETGDGLDVVADAIVQGAEEHLRSHSARTDRSGENPGAQAEIEFPEPIESAQVAPSDRDRSDEPMTAQERRRMQGLENRRRVAEVLYERPDARTAEIAEELGLGESTVRRIRREIDEEAGS